MGNTPAKSQGNTGRKARQRNHGVPHGHYNFDRLMIGSLVEQNRALKLMSRYGHRPRNINVCK